ncbi:MAG: hypothetical protein IJ681_01770 [Bacteroidales bacterium]|nr:hypothetical protein [Bacteroidales bacterium]
MWLKEHKSLILPIAMLAGIIGFNWFYNLMTVVIFTVSIMFFIAYCSLDFRRLRFTKVNIIMLVLHVVLIFVSYFLAKFLFSDIVAKGVLLCVLCPTAASSSAIVILLGGNKEISITHIILDSIMISMLAPLVLSYVEPQNDFSYLLSVITILKKVGPLLVLPFIVAVFFKRLKPKWTLKIAEYNWVSLIFWSVSLIIIFANTTHRIVNADKQYTHDIIIMFITSFIVFLLQFAIGKLLGRKLNQSVSVAQGISQKNTSLGVWLAHTYLSNPLSVVFSAAYSLWQNLINSLQVYLHDKKTQKNIR